MQEFSAGVMCGSLGTYFGFGVCVRALGNLGGKSVGRGQILFDKTPSSSAVIIIGLNAFILLRCELDPLLTGLVTDRCGCTSPSSDRLLWL